MKPTAAPPAPTWAIGLAFGLVYVCWGTTYLATKWAMQLEHLPPALFGGVRLGSAGLILLAFTAAQGGSIQLGRRDLLSLLVCGPILFAGGTGLLILAQTTISSSLTAVLAALTPLWIALFEWLWPGGHRLDGRSWFGLLLGLAGVVILMTPKLNDDPSRFMRELGPLLVLGSGASWAFGTVLLRYRRPSVDHLTGAAYQLIFGGGCLSLVGVLCGEIGRLPETITPRAALCFFWLLICGSLLGFVAYNWLLGHVPATRVGTYAYVNPAIAILVGWFDPLDREMPTWEVGAGIAVILIGVALVRGRGV